MDAPPLPAVVVATGLALNYRRSRRRDPAKPTISRWACPHKAAAVTFAAGFGAWWVLHWWLYVIELPDA